MNDHEFLTQFENCTLAKENFTHINHLRVAWLYLQQDSKNAIANTKKNILRYATSLGAAHIYHETLTHAWISLVNIAMKKYHTDFASFISDNAHLLDKNLPLQYYSQAHLYSENARQELLAPDLQPLSSF